ncbi:MFS transporter [Prosthecobacter sp.]|uniref:MFS transporter n=1 Tax=Prosthecobacter sp. TaxID=1965333 RepID=UPI0037844F5D
MSTPATATYNPDLPWYKQLSAYHWFVFFVASAAWCFDCLDQQLFILARDNAVKALAPTMTALEQGKMSGWAMSVFVAGWATGGLFFGAIGDRIGRAKTLALTVLIYSLFTGLSSFATDMTQFMVYRALTGLGVGGVFGLAVALVADALPEFARPKALGLLQALSAVGNVTAGLCAMALAGTDPMVSWKYLFWIGSVPAFLCIFIMLRLKEPEKWVAAKAASKEVGGKAMGSYMSLFGEKRWRSSALLGMLLCVAAVVGLWGVGFFSNKLVAPAIANALAAEKLSPEEIAKGKQWWAAANLIVMNLGAFCGMTAFSKGAHRFGRKPVFATAFIAAFVSTIYFYQNFNTRDDIWMSFVMGFCQLALFAGFAIYLPELFPTRLRSTGVSFCYNVGRFIAASGPLTLGQLQASLGAKAVAALPAGATDAAKAAAELVAFRNAACYLSGVFLLGLVALMFLPETKGRPMPED